MYFKKLEMHGFKSFAEPVSIEFHDGVTCIVGPNGSGKSNISDALRWVLGEQSPKMLRGGKMEEVIFAGTASRKSRGMAEVTLVIDNSTGVLPIDYNEVAITRRMFRSGESEYLINNNQCRLRDIRELIMDTGIGVDGYSIIGQGKIADIVSNKPESRREIFEEAAGVVMYKSKKAEAERKLNATNGNLERVNDIIGEIEGRIDGLRQDSIKAKEYLELKDKYKELEINITLKNIDSMELKTEQMKDDISELAFSISQLNESKQKLDGDLAEHREKRDSLQVLGTKAREELLDKVNQINEISNRDQLNTERLSSIDKDIERIDGEVKELLERVEREENSKQELDKTIEDYNKSIDDAQDKLTSCVEYYNELNGKAIDSNVLINGLKDKLFDLNGTISSKRSEAKSIENLKESLKKRKDTIASEKEENSAEQNSGKERLALAIEKQTNLEKEAKSVEDTFKKSIEKRNGLVTSAKELQVNLDDYRIKKSQMEARRKTIEEMESNYEGYNYAVKYVMKSSLRGIEGVVAELMDVPKGFEVAIETALGSAMQNVICQDDNSAKIAVNSLKANRAGRLTFLPLTSVHGRAIEIPAAVKGDKGFKGLAVDCINFDKKYNGIFSYLLGRVAIVDNMDSAINLSKRGGNLRFVTLDGEIINVSGAITGGKYKNTTANLLTRRSEITTLSQSILSIEEKQLELNNKKSNYEAEISKLDEEIEAFSTQRNELKIELLNCMNTVNNLKGADSDYSNQDKKLEKEMTSIEADFANADKMIEDIEEQVRNAEEEIKEINASLDSQVSEYDQLKEDVSQASQAITDARIESNNLISERDSNMSILSRIESTLEDYKFQIDNKNDNSAELSKEKNEILFGSDDAEELYKSKVAEKENLDSYIEQISQEMEELVKGIKEEEESVTKFSQDLSAYGDQKYALEIKLAKSETQLDTYKEKLWEEFEVSYVQAMDFRKKDFVMSQAVKDSREIKNRIKELGDVNIGAIKEYETVGERYEFLTTQRADIEKAMSELQSIIDDMEATIKTKFKDNFDHVVINFEKIFKELFGGGHAELRLEDCDDPLEAGIEIVAQPPGKKLQNINLMSGGEKTMTAIALMFAVLKTKPTPFCILDEVEAALDDANIDRFADYLKKFKEIQFALVTHQKATMEHADVLYGVTMPEQGISKVLSLKLEDKFEI